MIPKKQKSFKIIFVVIICILVGIGFGTKNLERFSFLIAKIELLNGKKQYVYKEQEFNGIIKAKLETKDNKKSTNLFNRTSINKRLSEFILEKQRILPILGKSEKLSSKQKDNMTEWRKDIVKFTQKNSRDMYISGPNKKMVALTFDDGPDKKITPLIIDILKDNNVKGNFFFLGEKIKKCPEVVKQAYDNGNIISSHGYYHNQLIKYTDEKIEEEIEATASLIKSIIGKKPLLIRPAYGDIDDRVLFVLKKGKFKTILWSIDSLDWSLRQRDKIIKNVIDNVRNGDIILLHSNGDKIETANALKGIILELKNQNYEIVDLEKLLKIKAYE